MRSAYIYAIRSSALPSAVSAFTVKYECKARLIAMGTLRNWLMDDLMVDTFRHSEHIRAESAKDFLERK